MNKEVNNLEKVNDGLKLPNQIVGSVDIPISHFEFENNNAQSDSCVERSSLAKVNNLF